MSTSAGAVGAVGETTQPCPQCGAEIRADGRFTVWCAGCDWNVDPGQPVAEHGKLERRRRRLTRRHGERLLGEVAAGETLRPRRDAAGIAAHLLALAVHGVTVALAVGAVWFLVTGWGGAGVVLGVFLAVLAWTLRPRFSELPDDRPLLGRADAPALFGLIDEVAAVVGTRGVDTVAVSAELNASVTTYGIRGRRLLTLGLPLWEILTPQERIAVLGHELGHYSNGDTRHGLIIGNALRSLSIWRYFVAPTPDPTLVEAFVNLVYLVPRSLLQGLLALLDRLTLRATQRAEYLADSMAARAGSTEAAASVMNRFLVLDSAETMLRREANAQQVGRGRRGTADREPWQGLWERLRAHMASIPETEYERQRRVAALRGHSVDATHPPTHLRRTCLLTGPPLSAAVTPDAGTESRISTELAAASRTVAQRIVKHGLAH
ncbi:M48 family metallopeptidase [Streptomyces beigongshangae]|uniref:M48 family metallopeptidase n=1 Tax=Streptomyces beigongshangae TaxID=2841597 RepID=UPI001C845254|nr:M48 family metallopeptidase [Streptomyces sp. REN17]